MKFRQIADFDDPSIPIKKGKKYEAFGGLVSGVTTRSGKSIRFDDEEYFTPHIKKKKKKKEKRALSSGG